MHILCCAGSHQSKAENIRLLYAGYIASFVVRVVTTAFCSRPANIAQQCLLILFSFLFPLCSASVLLHTRPSDIVVDERIYTTITFINPSPLL